ncbi:hypothetical protein GCM10022225_69480 [Plantactinospora mayteni]|uniref:Adenylate kinase n=1 Tax=Plantactinospora mayteni TaxID=566021 RepID=A0ABQ4EVV7_9ACTN|nr:AAA family ATPase [Plantactinospora mayteni]GIG98807.1 hypothetical protein Pma05_53800 [Plantactinospora mayteni]
MIAVIGPPGSGKTSVVTALAAHERVSVFRLREAIRCCPDLLADLPPSTDPLGWISDEAVVEVLRGMFLEHRFPTGGEPILLDNFPGTASQLRHLASIATSLGRRLNILELRANAPTLAARVAARRVCRSCGPDRHAPARPAASDPARCALCGGVLKRRDTDNPHIHALRLARYLCNRPKIAAAAARLHIPHLVLPAGHSAPMASRLARCLVAVLTDPAPAYRAASHPGSPK